MTFISKIKETQKLASQRNVHNWINCLFQSLMIIFIVSILLSIYTYRLSIFQDSSLSLLGLALPFIYGSILSYIVLEKLIILHILFYQQIFKNIFKGWQNFDMWYYRKYRKHSPITESLSRIQGKKSKLNRKLILKLAITLFIMINIISEIPIILDSLNEKNELPKVEQESMEDQNTKHSGEYEIIVKGGG